MALKLKPPETATGVALPAVEPLPSWLAPQQYAVPELVSPQV
jgi:hypothetical protein